MVLADDNCWTEWSKWNFEVEIFLCFCDNRKTTTKMHSDPSIQDKECHIFLAISIVMCILHISSFHSLRMNANNFNVHIQMKEYDSLWITALKMPERSIVVVSQFMSAKVYIHIHESRYAKNSGADILALNIWHLGCLLDRRWIDSAWNRPHRLTNRFGKVRKKSHSFIKFMRLNVSSVLNVDANPISYQARADHFQSLIVIGRLTLKHAILARQVWATFSHLKVSKFQ